MLKKSLIILLVFGSIPSCRHAKKKPDSHTEPSTTEIVAEAEVSSEEFAAAPTTNAPVIADVAQTQAPATEAAPETESEPATEAEPVTEAAPETEPETEAEPEPETEPPAPQVPDGRSFPIVYEDSGVKINIEKKWYNDTWCYVAHVRMTDYSRLKTGLANGSYGSSQRPASFAAEHGCLLTVNGDYAEGDRKSVLRRGVIYNADKEFARGVYSQNSGRLTEVFGESLNDLAGRGYTESFGFNAGTLVRDGVSIYLRKDGGKSAQRTLIGTTGEPGDIYIVVTEGRYTDGVSRGLQYYEAGDLLESLGCSFGFALDGGGSSAMVWNGRILTKTDEQKTTGFVYVTRP